MPLTKIKFEPSEFSKYTFNSQVAGFELEVYQTTEKTWSYKINCDDHTVEYGNSTTFKQAKIDCIEAFNNSFAEIDGVEEL